MKTTRRTFLQATTLASLGAAQQFAPAQVTARTRTTLGGPGLDAFAIAHEHTMKRDIPGSAFLEGMLLGNGDVGVCAVVRPDALGLHIGKNDCWDIRVSEDIQDHVLPFSEVLELWRKASEEAKKLGRPEMLDLEDNTNALREYTNSVASSYRNRWPRPWPCGTVWINWDPRWVEPAQYSLDPSNGLFTIDLRCSDLQEHQRNVRLSTFVDWETGLISVSTDGPLELVSLVFSPEIDGQRNGASGSKLELLPAPETKVNAGNMNAEFSAFQYLPAVGPTKESHTLQKSNKDRNFSLIGRVEGQWSVEKAREATDVSISQKAVTALRLNVQVATPRDILLNKLEKEAKAAGKEHTMLSLPQIHAYTPDELDTMNYARELLDRIARIPARERQQESETHWRTFWSHSAVSLDNKELERIWYHNQYFLACCVRRNKVAPGLFANWSSGNIGTAWHGDYHLDYNCQQVYWSVFSSNHTDLHGPYIELCENLRGMSEKFAQEKFNMPGACFPLSAYPVPSQAIPYPVPALAYQLSMTPWTVQSLWWHYLYTQDEEELRRLYPLLRSAARFVGAFVRKGDDQKFHVIPTVSSENWGFTVDFRLNKDCILDLALIRFLLNAVIQSSSILTVDESERARWIEISRNLAPYPQTKTAHGEVWLDVVDAPVDWVYNIPITLAPVFPGEQVGLEAEESLEIARRTARTTRLEGGNDLVYQPLIRARLGVLDLDWFVREVRYCRLPNGVANDRVRQSGGRYGQSTDFDFMMSMGVWCENFALPVVINECMMQSYTGTIRLFPNTTNLGPARFENLRAVGAFLLSATYDGKSIKDVSIFSEKGKPVTIVNPWNGSGIRITRVRDKREQPVLEQGNICKFHTNAGETYHILSA